MNDSPEFLSHSHKVLWALILMQSLYNGSGSAASKQ